jgi:hypothetical protein
MLVQQQIYLCIQRMPFKHRTDLFLLGYATKVNPMVANQTDVEEDIRTKWYSAVDRMAAEHNPPDHDIKFLENLDRLQEAKVIVDDVLQFPISVERNIIKATCPYHLWIMRPSHCSAKQYANVEVSIGGKSNDYRYPREV